MPALRTLSEYARPHSVQPGMVQPGMPHPQSPQAQLQAQIAMANLTGPDPILRYQMERAYLTGNREAQIDLMEREMRDRDIREMELREMEMRDREMAARHEQEKMHAHAIAANAMGASPFLHPGAPPPHPHLAPSPHRPPGFQHALERGERPPVPTSVSESAFSSQVDRINAERHMAMIDQARAREGLRPLTPHHHSHSHSHTHVHFHPQEHIHHSYEAAAAAGGIIDPGMIVPGTPGPPGDPRDPRSMPPDPRDPRSMPPDPRDPRSMPPGMSPGIPGPPGLRPPPPPVSVGLPGNHPHPILTAGMPPPRLYGPPGMSEVLAAQLHHEQIHRQMMHAESQRHMFPPGHPGHPGHPPGHPPHM